MSSETHSVTHDDPPAETTARTLFLIILCTAAAFVGASLIMVR